MMDMSVNDQNGMSNSNKGPSIDASYHVSVHLTKLLQSRRLLEIDQSETLLPVATMFVSDRNKMSNRYRESSIDASYQVSVHLAKQFQRRRFLEIDQLETRIACGSHIC